ncbi:MAG: GNAT family N-acetyltransferase [Rhodobacteraceae bacterium]|jgi:GNAT superfamily N-acetyltransferase|uniref:GNAT family N-acetyltransferase n=1 Tax=Albidovulum sp. TaxID=1872424 RepID=UPI001DD81EC6|nr:GNAT family N-acetyltransferase [uncultured Defluviimonas sp.]MCB2125340.1 GNAT family N-acetyltransferase [Paracoccaceae bacterium]MCC0070254.1 GNAT family N-acetyltransferase [Paracoccaceae bacterium]
MTITIRDATPDDEAEWRRLWDGYLAFYDIALAPEITAATWARLMDPASPLKLRLALRGDRFAGFALHQHHPSSWVAGDDCYLEDLFVDAEARGSGVGRALIDDLIALARARGWHRLYWHTDEGNARARTLYDSYTASDGHIRYRMRL